MIFLGARRLYNLFSLLMILIYVTATKPCADILRNTMNRELQKVTSWFTSNKLPLNLKETYFMILKTKRKKFKEMNAIKINGQIIDQVKWTTFRV